MPYSDNTRPLPETFVHTGVQAQYRLVSIHSPLDDTLADLLRRYIIQIMLARNLDVNGRLIFESNQHAFGPAHLLQAVQNSIQKHVQIQHRRQILGSLIECEKMLLGKRRNHLLCGQRHCSLLGNLLQKTRRLPGIITQTQPFGSRTCVLQV